MMTDPNHAIDVTLLTMKVLEAMTTGDLTVEDAEERLRVINAQYPQDCPHCEEPIH